MVEQTKSFDPGKVLGHNRVSQCPSLTVAKVDPGELRLLVILQLSFGNIQEQQDFLSVAACLLYERALCGLVEPHQLQHRGFFLLSRLGRSWRQPLWRQRPRRRMWSPFRGRCCLAPGLKGLSYFKAF